MKKLFCSFFLMVISWFHSSTSLYFGANIILPQLKDLSSAVNKASTMIDQLKPNLCTIGKTLLIFDYEDYVDAAKAITDVEYLFEDVQLFFGSSLNCFNVQSSETTIQTSGRNIDNLIYQLDIYISTGFNKLYQSGKVLGRVYDETVSLHIERISSSFSSEFETVKESLKILRDNILESLLSDSVLTPGSLAANINDTALTDLITAFKDLQVSTQQLSTVVAGLKFLTITLDIVSSSISYMRDKQNEAIQAATYDLDITTQAAIRLFNKNTVDYQDLTSKGFDTFLSFSTLSLQNDSDIQSNHLKVENFVINIYELLERNSVEFTETLNRHFNDLSQEIRNVGKTLKTVTRRISDLMVEVLAANSGTFNKCFAETHENALLAHKALQVFGKNITECIKVETNMSLKAESLISFIVEDIVLNIQGASDQLCACTRNDVVSTKECIESIASEMELSLLNEETTYIESEMDNLKVNITMDIGEFTTCIETATVVIEEDFKRFQESVYECILT
ncbi:CLUMA_CG018470, isoform A [Clunio marinus]|uniref:CLUMA_CG018470, isoform A n=1 Tax=Clunio marinus TaxID=568069 RepID=A0A1J1IYD8_9DIPT|nr:CLUMA_CG018470, isoform A [Clunio marinus]